MPERHTGSAELATTRPDLPKPFRTPLAEDQVHRTNASTPKTQGQGQNAPILNQKSPSTIAGSGPGALPENFTSVIEAFRPDAALRLVQKYIDKGALGEANTVAALSMGEPRHGAYHILFPILVDGRPIWLIKVPSNGVAGKWTEESADALLSEALTMAYLTDNNANTTSLQNLPIPRVLSFSTTVNNSLSCAYIAISYIDGYPLHAVWYGHLTNPTQFDTAGALARQRRTLECLVDIQAHLGHYTSKQGGMLRFSPHEAIDGHTFVIGSPPPQPIGIGPGRMPDQEKMLQIAVRGSDTNSGTDSARYSETRDEDGSSNGADPSEEAQVFTVLNAVDDSVQSSSALRILCCFLSFWQGLLPARVTKYFRSQSPATQPVQFEQFANSRAIPTVISDPVPRISSQEARSHRSKSSSGASSKGSLNVSYFTWGPLSDMRSYITGPLDVNPPTHSYQQGVHKLLRHMISWIPDKFARSNNNGEDKFVLAHPDLNMQNVIVDEGGTVVGLIDWDSIAAVPRAFGNETYPSFLTRDWDPNIYTWSASTRQNSLTSSPRSIRMHEDSPNELRELRRTYLQLMERKQEKDHPFTKHYRELCVQSIVVENVFLAAYDPMSRIQTMAKVISEAWAAYLNATGHDLTEFSVFTLIDQINAGELEEGVLQQLENAFLELLKAPDTYGRPAPAFSDISPTAAADKPP